MADLSAGGLFPHRVAVNNWHGPSAAQPSPGSAGMRHYELLLRDEGEMEQARRAGIAGEPRRLSGADGESLQLNDPAGNLIAVSELRQ